MDSNPPSLFDLELGPAGVNKVELALGKLAMQPPVTREGAVAVPSIRCGSKLSTAAASSSTDCRLTHELWTYGTTTDHSLVSPVSNPEAKSGPAASIAPMSQRLWPSPSPSSGRGVAV